MKKSLITSMLLLPLCGNAMSFAQATKIYNKLVQTNQIKTKIIFEMNNSPTVNAYAVGRKISINKGLLKFVGNDEAQVALVIGHEIGHIMLGHSGSTVKNEFAADRYGAILITVAGYNVCSGAKFFSRFETGDGVTHPYSSQRLQALGCNNYKLNIINLI